MNTKKNWKTEDTDNLFKAVLSLGNIEECENFFRDLLTEQEIETFAARFKSALMLDKGISYRKISAETGMSTATVTRINNWLERGMGGYKLAIANFKNNQNSEISRTSRDKLFHHRSKTSN
ncbi:hypothetical protein GF389_01540 [Candidatus Dojkabacteria bacterium]|nr:hypothetical protein [Candidatus Dojkabacteria bacterium]